MARAGRMRDRCVIERPVSSVDAAGNAYDGWTHHATVWGEIKPETASEAMAAGRIEAQTGAVLRVRYSAATAAVTSACRVTINGQVWQCQGGPVDLDRKRSMLDISLEAGPAA
ncbi:phage head closure protein [Tistrella bauzanensis]|uniref:phage head closure protein n=1 Tax=Tistrella TaxID=171436 RepID=UPI0031F621D4